MNTFNEESVRHKRKSGEFFTNNLLATYTGSKLLSMISVDLVIEPYAGEGSLIELFIENGIECIVNEKDSNNFSLLKQKFSGKKIQFYNEDFIASNIDTIVGWIKGSTGQKLLIYTNPPFGTGSTNILARKKLEQRGSSSKIAINYHGLDKIYGKGDLILPAIGKIIESINNIEMPNIYFAFYSPVGLFCRRKRYNALLSALLRHFTFIWGEIFSGNQFQHVNKKKPITLTLWKFNKDCNSPISTLQLHFEDKIIPLKPLPLLKDYWKYDTRKVISGEIAVQGNDRFNVMAPKMFHLKLEKGGSEVRPENLIKPLHVGYIPDELALALWSVTVGYRSLTSYPLYVDNAYVHLPDFSMKEIQKVLALTALYVIITEKNNRYTEGMIDIEPETGSIKFGSEHLTKGVNFLINQFKKKILCNSNIEDILCTMQTNSITKEDIKSIKRTIKEEIEKILIETRYWDFIPLPINK